MAREGFHGATVDAVAERAGFSIGALYANFKSKDELFFAVFEEHMNWFEAEVARVVDADDPVEAIAHASAAMAKDRAQFLVFIEFWAYAVRKPSLRRKLATRMDRMRDVLVSALAARPEQGAAEPALPPETLAMLGLALGRGLTLERFVNPGAVSDRAIGEVLGGLVVPQRPGPGRAAR